MPGIGGMIRDAQRYNQTDVVIVGDHRARPHGPGLSSRVSAAAGADDPLARPRVTHALRRPPAHSRDHFRDQTKPSNRMTVSFRTPRTLRDRRDPVRVALSDAGFSAVTTAQSPGASEPPAPTQIRIGYQAIPNGDLVVKHEGWLEAALPNTTIAWTQFDSGADVNTAVLAGAVDIGLAGSSPVTRGSVRAEQHPLPGAVDLRRHRDPPSRSWPRNDSGVTDVAGLKGKTIGTPFASTSHLQPPRGAQGGRSVEIRRHARRPRAGRHPGGLAARRHRGGVRLVAHARRAQEGRHRPGGLGRTLGQGLPDLRPRGRYQRFRAEVPGRRPGVAATGGPGSPAAQGGSSCRRSGHRRRTGHLP